MAATDVTPRPGPAAVPDGVVVSRPPIGRGVVVILLLVVTAGLWAIATDPPAVLDRRSQPPTLPEPAAPPVPPVLARRTGAADLGLAIAVTSPGGAGGRLLRWSATESSPRLEPGFDLTEARFDASGRWVAGLAPERSYGGGSVLWAGALAGRLEVADIGVSGFAWHDQRPGRLGWSDHAHRGTAIVEVDLTKPDPDRSATAVAGHLGLRSWGDWGYALAAPPHSYLSTVLGAQGLILFAQEPGFAAGFLPGSGLLSARPGQLPGSVSVVDLVSLDQRPLAASRFGEFAWSVATAPSGDATAIHLARGEPRSIGSGGRIVVLDRQGALLAEVRDVVGWAAMAWSADSSTLAFARQGDGAAPRVVLRRLDDSDEASVAIPGLTAADRVTALSLSAGLPEGGDQRRLGLAGGEGRL